MNDYRSMTDELEKIAKQKIVRAGGARFRFSSQPGSLQITKESALAATVGKLVGTIQKVPGAFKRAPGRLAGAVVGKAQAGYRGAKQWAGSQKAQFREARLDALMGPKQGPLPKPQGKPSSNLPAVLPKTPSRKGGGKEKGKGGLSWGKAGLIAGGAALGGAGIGLGHMAGRFYDAQTAPPYAPYR
jgi:hypothetical protein